MYMTQNFRILGIPKNTRRLLKRALALTGGQSQSKWLSTLIRQEIRRAQEKYGDDLFEVLTVEERDLLEVIANGAAEIGQMSAETLQPEKRVNQLLHDLVEREYLEVRRKGGKTEQARGARIALYFVTEKYKPKPE